MKVLAFTVSYRRPYFLRHCVTQLAVQTHRPLLHSVSVTDDSLTQGGTSCADYLRILFSDIDECRTTFSFRPNRNQHLNYLSAITSVADFRKYDLFVKIDDDDIYKPDYVSRCVEFHEQTGCDISSTGVSGQINGQNVRAGKYRDLGRNPPGSDFCMPQTFAFNLAALEAIIDVNPAAYSGWEDEAWRHAWVKRGLMHRVRADESAFVWHVHGRNVSVGGFLQTERGPLSEKTIFRAFDCVHEHWIGTVYLYDDGTSSVSPNGDLGSWTFVEKQVLELRWERWPAEVLFYSRERGHYECREKRFVAADVTMGRRHSHTRLPHPQVSPKR